MNNVSIRCYYTDGTYTKHYQELELKDLRKWIEAYRFTHPNVRSISIRVWFEGEGAK